MSDLNVEIIERIEKRLFEKYEIFMDADLDGEESFELIQILFEYVQDEEKTFQMLCDICELFIRSEERKHETD